jgi:uncharacterized glyoxalase superfamily protein PhnB
MRLTPNLAFGGQCEAAFKFYERCFGGKIVFMLTYGKSPMAEQVPPRWREKIFHATLTVGDNVMVRWRPKPLIDTVFTIPALFLRYNPRTESL